MTRLGGVIAVCLTCGTAPVAALQSGSVGIHGGLSPSGPGLAGAANFLAEFGPFSLGPEVGASSLGDGADVWHVGGAFGLDASVGISIGAGAWLTRPASGLSLGAALRWHRQLQSVGAPEEMSFVTVMLGLALHW